MAKDKKKAVETSFLSELVRSGIFKRNQGKVTRQVTFAAIAITVALGCRSLSIAGTTWGPAFEYGLPLLILIAGIWITFRLVNWPQFTNFLIAVEAEMNKVSWPSRDELIRSSLVVIIVIFLLAGLLFGFDMVWWFLFKTLKVLH